MPDLAFGAPIWELTIYHLSTGATTKRQSWFHNSYKEENSLPFLLPLPLRTTQCVLFSEKRHPIQKGEVGK